MSLAAAKATTRTMTILFVIMLAPSANEWRITSLPKASMRISSWKFRVVPTFLSSTPVTGEAPNKRNPGPYSLPLRQSSKATRRMRAQSCSYQQTGPWLSSRHSCCSSHPKHGSPTIVGLQSNCRVLHHPPDSKCFVSRRSPPPAYMAQPLNGYIATQLAQRCPVGPVIPEELRNLRRSKPTADW